MNTNFNSLSFGREVKLIQEAPVEVNGIVLDWNEYENDTVKACGFTCYRSDGHSLPKGFLSSFSAQCRKLNGVSADTHIEFSFQSPTGDSSDFHRYTYPCLTWEQAKEIVIRNYVCHQYYVSNEAVLDEFTL